VLAIPAHLHRQAAMGPAVAVIAELIPTPDLEKRVALRARLWA
jgi:hypothetical protein